MEFFLVIFFKYGTQETNLKKISPEAKANFIPPVNICAYSDCDYKIANFLIQLFQFGNSIKSTAHNILIYEAISLKYILNHES